MEKIYGAVPNSGKKTILGDFNTKVRKKVLFISSLHSK
jgi:hypothetical protein